MNAAADDDRPYNAVHRSLAPCNRLQMGGGGTQPFAGVHKQNGRTV